MYFYLCLANKADFIFSFSCFFLFFNPLYLYSLSVYTQGCAKHSCTHLWQSVFWVSGWYSHIMVLWMLVALSCMQPSLIFCCCCSFLPVIYLGYAITLIMHGCHLHTQFRQFYHINLALTWQLSLFNGLTHYTEDPVVHLLEDRHFTSPATRITSILPKGSYWATQTSKGRNGKLDHFGETKDILQT